MSTSSIQLRLINKSAERDNATVVIFQKNQAPEFAEIAVAWKTIQNLGLNDYHPFSYDYNLQVSANDSYGNFMPNMDAPQGASFEVIKDATGNVLREKGASTSVNAVDVNNNLGSGAIGANIYRSGTLLSTKQAIAPGQKATFEFKPTIWVGVVSQVEQGQVMDAAVISQVNHELSLTGIASADIIWTGGGPGASSRPYQFTLENVVMA